MASERKTGTILPSVLGPTTRPEPVAPAPAPAPEPTVEQGGEPEPMIAATASEARTPKVRKRRPGQATPEKLEGRRLYLSEDVHFRLRMLAYQRGRKISEVAQEVLDKALPRYDVNRVG